ncbi:MAG: hypothetical protein GX879_05295 [Bacteroidales bacterium]|nr:hypothetical protein [Bacteroidales bacterium]
MKIKRIAIPIDEGNLGCQLGNCNQFMIYEIDSTKSNLVKSRVLEHNSKNKNDLLNWFAEIKISDLISHHIDKELAQFLLENKINVFVGIPLQTPEALLNAYIEGSLVSNENVLHQNFNQN